VIAEKVEVFWNRTDMFSGSCDAQVAHERWEKIRAKKPDRKIRDEDIVADASDERAPTHTLFEWNQKRAAHEYRLTQARFALRSLRVMTVLEKGREPEPVRLYVHVKPEPIEDEEVEYSVRRGGYMTVEAAMTDPSTEEILIEKALTDLRAWRARYAQLKSLADLFRDIDRRLEATR